MAEKKLGERRMDYQEQLKHNEWVFLENLKMVRPDLWMLADLLQATRVNYLVLVHVMRHIANIATGSKYGEVKVQIQNGVVTFVHGEETSKLNEPAILPKKEEE